jgi:hypothetical protein
VASCKAAEEWRKGARSAPLRIGHLVEEATMNEDNFNMSIRKFLKTVGVTAQREIEKAVRQALAEGKLKDKGALKVVGRITLPAVALDIEIDGELDVR